MKVKVISTDGLDKKTIEKIQSSMTFNKYWFENDTVFVEIQNSKGEIIRIFPERIKSYNKNEKLPTYQYCEETQQLIK